MGEGHGQPCIINTISFLFSHPQVFKPNREEHPGRED